MEVHLCCLMPEEEVNIQSRCYHCGSACEEDVKVHDEKQFCCSGCLAVHSILMQNSMGDYYQMENFPGVKSQGNTTFDFADNPEIVKAYIDFQNDTITQIKLKVPAIHCSSCIWLLENLHQLNDGILQVRVNFQEQEAQLTFKHEIVTVREVLELLDKIGYTPDLAEVGGKKDKRKSKLIKQLAFAGFAFGNIMLFSFPDYFGLVTSEDHSYGKVFSYLNFLISIPLVLYSGKDYLKTAYESIRMKTVHIYVPVSIGILALFCWSSYAVLSGIGPGYFDSLAGLLFFLLIGKWLQEYTNKKLIFDRKYESYFPLSVQLLVDGEEEIVPLHSLEKGDRIRVRKGELIPADGHLFSGVGQIDYSFVTGESVPEHRELGEMVFAGGRQLAQAIEIEITSKVKESKLVSLWYNESPKELKTGASKLIDSTSKVFTITLLTIAALTFLFWVNIDLNKAIFSTVSVLIVACPCALALAYPFATGTAKRLLARSAYYLKNAEVIERLSGINTVIFDKTGTLTQTTHYKLNYYGKSLSNEEKSMIRSLANESDHPYSKSISKHWAEHPIVEMDSFKEVPGKGMEGWVKDTWIKLGSESHVFLDTYSSHKEYQVYISINGNYVGAFDFNASYYPFIKPLLASLKNSFALHLCTGDSKKEEAYLKNEYAFDSMKFKAEPMQKVEYIKSLNEEGSTLYLGDGLNDAGALLNADVGVAVTKSLIHFTPASDIITKNENLPLLPQVLSYSKDVMHTVKVGIIVSALYNVVGLYFAVQGMLSPLIAAIIMPISSITTVILMTGLTHFYAKRKKLI